MEAPKNLYINIKSGALLVNTNGQIKNDCIKYIRADLAKLTTDKIIDIICLVNEVQADIESHRLGTFRTPDEFAKEVLSRFLESKSKEEI